MSEPKYRRPLNKNQIDILECLFKYRFGTTDLIAEYLSKVSGNVVRPRLKTLAEQGFVSRHFNANYVHGNKHAAYYLLPDGLKAVQRLTNNEDITTAVIKNSYNDYRRSEQFIDHCLEVFTISSRLKAIYRYYLPSTKRELTTLDYFPKMLPDLYLSFKFGDDVRRFLLDYFEAEYILPRFAVERRIRHLIEHNRTKAWQSMGGEYPPVLFVCADGATERRVQKQVRKVVSTMEAAMLFYTTTKGALHSSTKRSDEIWTNPLGDDALYSLSTLTVNP